MRDQIDPFDFFLTPARLGSITPEGWLEKQLVAQKNGLTGHIDEIWEDLGPQSGWLGGPGESWERGPYYLDGLIPLAWELKDIELKKKAAKWIEWMLQSQDESGFFGPKSNTDWWPRIVALKALMQYHQATEDECVLPFMDRYFRYQLKHLPERPFQMWGTARCQEQLIIIHYLYMHSKEEYLIRLADIVSSQCYRWGMLFCEFPFRKPTNAYLNRQLFKLIKEIIALSDRTSKKFKHNSNNKVKSKEKIEKENASKLMRIFHKTHSVNLAMALKMPALHYLFCHDRELLKAPLAGIDVLTKYHGLANFVFSGDEHLSGRSPTAGAELCEVVEYMYSLETLFAITGDTYYANLLEQVAYNALPAAISADMCAHQYLQQVNQVEVSCRKRDWYDCNEEANLFGLEPNFGCCTANMHQGWPKLLNSLLLEHTEGIATGVYAPCSARLRVDNVFVELKESTDYPFNDTVKFVIEDIHNEAQTYKFKFFLRIPDWAARYKVFFNDEIVTGETENGFFSLARQFRKGDRIRLQLSMPLRLKKEEAGVTLHLGPLLLALPVEHEKRIIRGRPPFVDYELLPKSKWSYAIVESEIKNAEVQVNGTGLYPFDDYQVPVKIKIRLAPVDKWSIHRNSAGHVPMGFRIAAGRLEEKILVPYGCARLRIAQFPLAATEEEK